MEITARFDEQQNLLWAEKLDRVGVHVIYGVMLLIMMLFRPHGLIPEARRKMEFEHGVHDEPLYDSLAGDVHIADESH